MLSSSSPSSTATSPAPTTTATLRQPRPNNLDFVPQRVDHALSWSSLMSNRPSQSQANRRQDTSRQYQAVSASVTPMTTSSTDSEGEAPAPRRRRLNPQYRRQQYTTAGPSRTPANGASSYNNVDDSSDEMLSNSGRVSCAEQPHADNQDAWADNESQSMRSESESDSSAFEDEMSEEDDDEESEEVRPRRRPQLLYPNNLNHLQYPHPYQTGHYFRRNAPPQRNRPVFSPASSSSSLGSTYLQVVPYSAPTPAPAPAPTNTLPQLENLPPVPQPMADYADQPPMVVNGEEVDPVQASNPNPGVLGIENLALFEVLRDWAARGYYGHQDIPRPAPDIDDLLVQERRGVFDIGYEDLRADHCDFQGINWKKMKSTRFTGRMRRQQTYRNYVNRLGSDQWTPLGGDAEQSHKESFFKFKRMHVRPDVRLAHFQLRNVLACPTRTHAYFPGPTGVYHFNTASRQIDTFLSMRDIAANDDLVSTLDARYGVLMCGLFNGDYIVKPLDSTVNSDSRRCHVSADRNGITNHVKLYQSRHSSSPMAAIASNDNALRLYDVASHTLVRETYYPFALNGTALSPDKRQRAIVGDDFQLLITEEETGRVLQRLPGHRDYIFSCDWSDNGYHIASGSQDMAIQIWDARRFTDSSGRCTPLTMMKTELAGARTLRFSPNGSGTPVLVAAEEADYINIIETRKLRYRQKLDVFSEIAGVDFADEGRDLNILCADPHRGGLLQLQRCGRGAAGVCVPDKPWEKWNNLPDDDMPCPF